jgi:hypothetical protein
MSGILKKILERGDEPSIQIAQQHVPQPEAQVPQPEAQVPQPEAPATNNQTAVVLDVDAPGHVFLNSSFKIRGKLRPCAGEDPIEGEPITLERADNMQASGFQSGLAEAVTTNRNGEFEIPQIAPSKKGTFYFRAVYAGSDQYAAVTSSELTVTVARRGWRVISLCLIPVLVALTIFRLVAPDYFPNPAAWYELVFASRYLMPVLVIVILIVLAFTLARSAFSSSRFHDAWRDILYALAFIATFALAVVVAMSANEFSLTAATNPMAPLARIFSWFIFIAAIAVLSFYLGETILQRGTQKIDLLQKLLGILIDSRNRVSLARLQVALWTILILATFAEAALANIIYHAGNPIGIVTIPDNIALILGISIVAVPASNAANSPNKCAHPSKVEKSIKVLNKKGAAVKLVTDNAPQLPDVQQKNSDNDDKCRGDVQAAEITRPSGKTEAAVLYGTIVARPSVKDARLTDVLTGDQISNYGFIDMSKLQLLLFNVVLIIVYAVGAAFYLTGTLPFQSLPNVPDLMAGFLAISNAGYLGYKALPGIT